MVAPAFSHVLVVCVGNICRSPTAEYLLRNALSDNAVTVASAGLGALSGRGVDEQAARLLSERGIDCSAHRARQLDSNMLHEADVVLAMERGHIDAICAMAPEVRGKTFLLGKWLDDLEVPDPFRRSDDMFREVYAAIDKSVQGWVPVLRGRR